MSEFTQPTPERPLESLFARLEEALGELAPDAVLNRMRPVVEGFFEQFELVPKREYESHLSSLARLEQTVAALEARVAELEQNA